jgi:CubicO group peptidase (beta-lactamase class C family)
MIIQQVKSEIMSVKVKEICLKGTLLLNFMLFLQFVIAQKIAPSPYDFSAVTKKLEASKSELGKLYAVQITKDGLPIYKKESTDFDTKTAAPIGIVTQWITAALILQLVDEGKIGLDDKIGKYLPIFDRYSKKYITIRHCLTHSTGIKNSDGNIKLFEKNVYFTLEDEVNTYASKRDIEKNAGEAFRYNEIGFAIAGKIIEVVTKKTFSQIFTDKIAKPLGMRFTTFVDELDRTNTSNGCFTTGVDMSNFLTMLLNNGTFNGKRILSETAIEQLETLSINTATIQYLPLTFKKFDYGLGCFIVDKNNSGKANTIAAFSLFGTFMYIDRCRKYAFVATLKKGEKEASESFYLGLKNVIDEALGSCIN